MYYQNYEDYMRSVLGYPVSNSSDLYETENYYIPMDYYPAEQNRECAKFYPEIYKIVQPIVVNACMQVPMPVTEEWLEEMTNKIYDDVQKNEKIRIVFNFRTNEMRTGELKNPTIRTERPLENRQRSNLLSDFIRILILNQILGGRRPQRPHRPPYPTRPPYPGTPGPMPPRPRDYM